MALTAAQLLVRVGADTSEAEAGLNKVGRSITQMASSTARTLGIAGAGMTAALTAPLVALGSQALSSAADFERSMNILASVTSAPADAMAALQEQALQLGAQTSFSAGEAAAAMLELGKAGMDAAEIGDSIAGVMDLAAAGGIELAEAATVTSAALNTFQLDASESARIANLLAGAANASAADMSDLALSMTQAGPGFALTNQSIEDMTTSIALLANVGQSGSKAGTNLNRAMQSLIRPTDKARKLMDKLGIDVFDASGEMLDMTGIIAEFNMALVGMTTEQRAAALSTILMGEGVDAMVPLLDAGVEGFTEMRTQVTAHGQAATTAAARMSGLSGAMEYLSGSVDSFLIGAALPFLDFVGQIVRGVADLITSFGRIPEPVRNAALAFAGVLAAAGPILGVLAAVAGAFALLGSAAAPILLVTAAVAGLAAAIAYLASIGTIDLSGLWTSVTTGFQSALDAVQLAIAEFRWSDYVPKITWSDFVTAFDDWSTYVSNLVWEAYIFSLDWGLFIDDFLWDTYVLLLTWDHYVETLDWKGFVTALVDWGTWIPALAWNAFVTVIDWATYVGAFVWSEWLSKLDWGSVIPTFGEWATWLVTLDWGEIIPRFNAWSDYIVALTWDSFIEKLEWPQFVSMVDWNAYLEQITWSNFVATMNDWSQWIAALDWKQIIATIVDWGVYIAVLPWNEFVRVLDWITYLGVFVWSEWISKLTWSDVITAITDWGTWIANLDWGAFIASITDWTVFIGKVAWDSFIEHVEWPAFISMVDWGSLIPEIDWTSFIPEMDWPTPGEIVDAIAAKFAPPPTGPVGPQTGAGTRRDTGRPWTGGGFGPFERPLEMPGPEFDVPLKAMITEVEPAATLKPLQIKGMVTEMAEAGMGAGDALTKGAATIGSTLSGFSWPALPVFEFPALPPFSWPAYPTWTWPPIQAPDWLNRLVVPRPEWLGTLLAWSPVVQVRAQAVTVPGAISAPPATVSAARAGEGEIGAASVGAAGVTIGPVYVRSELDIEQLAYRVTQLQNQRG